MDGEREGGWGISGAVNEARHHMSWQPVISRPIKRRQSRAFQRIDLLLLVPDITSDHSGSHHRSADPVSGGDQYCPGT